MKPFTALLVCLSLVVGAAHCKGGKKWALLAASANNWDNYGMQADVYHAYQVFRQGGVPEDQIIVMAYDDVASSGENPYKGEVFQSYDLHDVYSGVKIDYKGDTVNKKTFLSILEGDKEAVERQTGRAGKVIESGPDDNVFVFISNHGGPGLVGWLDGNHMTAKELNSTITKMYTNKKYGNLVIYIDTCFSGSMFENILPSNIGVYAATASSAKECALSSDCYSEAFRDAPTCLGGLFSINWVYELQSDERTDSTMDMQFQEAKIACQGLSNPVQYGDLSIAQKNQADFFGDSAQYKKPATHSKRFRRSSRAASSMPKNLMAYHHMKNQLVSLPEGSRQFQIVRDQLATTESLMASADQFLKDISQAVYGRFATQMNIAWAESNFGLINWRCYEPVLEAVTSQCPGMVRTEQVRYYAYSKFGVLVNLCNEVSTVTVIDAVKAAARINPLCGVY